MRLRHKNAVIKVLAAHFTNLGKVLDSIEFRESEFCGVRYGQIQSFFGTYDRMLNFMRKSYPELFDMVQEPVEEIDAAKAAMAKAAMAKAAAEADSKEV